MNKKRTALIVLTALILIALAYLLFFYTRNCKDLGCFNINMEKCQRARLVKDTEEAVWSYSIIGKSDGNCNIKVILKEIKGDNEEFAGMQGKEMVCSIPLSVVSDPANNIQRCHGLLKEEMQERIISNLNKYITDNI
ncbi:hypothetical protein HYW76_05110 [Candidatus Pacearchaeota archaeon]|nr:hypothetical protein [Candidatus Pacearchaeota archaeon]